MDLSGVIFGVKEQIIVSGVTGLRIRMCPHMDC